MNILPNIFSVSYNALPIIKVYTQQNKSNNNGILLDKLETSNYK